MPVLSNFISYRPGRKNKQLRSPFQIRHLQNAPLSPHPYASPPVIDINDGGAAPSRTVKDFNADEKELPDSPHMKLNLEFNDEPLGDLFPLNFLKPDSPFIRTSEQGKGSSTTQGRNAERSVDVDASIQDILEEESTNTDEEQEGEEDASSSEVVLANLEAMDATAFINVTGSDEHDDAGSTSWRKLPPAPIKIPGYGHRTHAARSREPSRPTSQISSIESSAISGTTLARALIANTFVLSSDSRGSRYRSGVSLVRADSATLPRGEFALLHSPYWRERTNSGGEMTLSPSSLLSPPVPPVPDNAELVYVPPKAARHASETRPKRRDSAPGNVYSERGSDLGTAPNEEVQISRRFSRIFDQTASLPSKPQHPVVAPPDHDHSSPGALKEGPDRSPGPILVALDPILPLEPSQSPRRLSSNPRESDISSEPIASPVPSEAPSSARDIDNVLDYYSMDASPEQTLQGFRPAFSPIREETSSQLSPASAYRQDPKKAPSTGRSYLGTTPSPFSAGVRVEWSPHQRRGSDSRTSQNARDGTTKPLLPIGERPRSVQVSPSSFVPPPTLSRHKPPSRSPSLNGIAPFNSHSELLPSLSTVFNHQRSGSAPSPIQVVRDTHDDNAYNITVTSLSEGSRASTPSTVDSDIVQTFPEAPGAPSSVFTAASVTSPGMAPQEPMSAFPLQNTGEILPSLAQQILLTRAATSVHGARPNSRQSMAKMNRQPLPQTKLTVLEEPPEDENTTDSPKSTDVSAVVNLRPPTDSGSAKPDAEQSASVDVTPATQTDERPAIEAPLPVHKPPANKKMTLSQQPSTSLEQVILLPPITPLALRTPPSESSLGSGSSAPSESSVESTESPRTRPKGLPRIPPSPKMLPPAPPQQGRSARPSSGAASSATPPGRAPDDLNPIITRRTEPERSTPRPDPTPFSTSVTASITGSSGAQAQPPSLQAQSPSLQAHSPSLQAQLLASPPLEPHTSASPSYSLLYHSRSGSLGSPPPYHTVVNSADDLTPSSSSLTPSTAGSYGPSHNRFHLPHSASPNTVEFSKNDTIVPSGQSSPSHQARGPRTRPYRPPLPAGPRRPSQTNTALPNLRNRGGSVSSINSNVFPSSGSRRPNPGALPPIKFETPPIKWKGFTLDAAKWTFTSAQLQDIVSRAIRQSAEPSSLRLVRLETLDDEIPPEIERLETQRSDIKLKYKALARRRHNLLETLAIHVDGSEEGSGVALRLVVDLRDVSASLDKLTEELHRVDEQLAQLSQLCLVHSSSALAMALRKLNTSLLKQLAEAQVLRNQVQSLEAERDDAWKQAEEVAIEYEDLRNGKTDTVNSENRFGRVVASRKSSLRASKAGLRPPSRCWSQRSSMSSNRAQGSYSPSSSRAPQFAEDIPPVPPIPRRRPTHIRTDMPMRGSVSTTTSGPTPNSDTRALAQAQEELYELLGINIDDTRSRRPRSVGGRPIQSLHMSPSINSISEPPNSGRRASLPGSAQPDVYNALAADVSIMLTADRAGWI